MVLQLIAVTPEAQMFFGAQKILRTARSSHYPDV